MAEQTQATTEQPMDAQQMPELMMSGPFTMGGIFLVWAGLLIYGVLLMRRVKSGAFRVADEGEKSFVKVPPFEGVDKWLAFSGSALFMAGFVMIILDLFQ